MMDIRMSAFPVNNCGHNGYVTGIGIRPSAGHQVTLDMNCHPPVLDTAVKSPPGKTNSSLSRSGCKFGGQWLASIRNMYNSMKSSENPVTWVNPDLVPQFEPRPVQALPMVMPLPFPQSDTMQIQNSSLWYEATPESHNYYQDPFHIYNQSYPSEIVPIKKIGAKKSSQPLNPEAKEWVPSSFRSNKVVSSNPACPYFSSNVSSPLVIETTAVSVGFVEISEKEISDVREILKYDIPKVWNASVENNEVSPSNAKRMEKSNIVGKSSEDNIQNGKFCSSNNTESKQKSIVSGKEEVKDTLTYASIARISPEPPQRFNLVGDTYISPCDMVKQPIPRIFTKDKKYPKEKAPTSIESKQRDLPFRTVSRIQKVSSRKFLKDLKDCSPAKSDCSLSESASSTDSNADVLSRVSFSGSSCSLTLPSSVSLKDRSTPLSFSTPKDGKSSRSLSESSGNSSHNRTTSESSTGSGVSVDIEFNDDLVTEDGKENSSDVDETPKAKYQNSILAHILGLDSDSEESEEETDDDWDNVDGECTSIILDDSWETFGLVFQPPSEILSSNSTSRDSGCSEMNIIKSGNICDTTNHKYCNSNLDELNRRWESDVTKDIKAPSPCRVQFGKTSLHPMVAWQFAYKNARRGLWEQYARDRVRFNNRIEALEPILSSVLEGSHRETMYQKIYGS
ncbi:uncharacterized protein [Palaemon carinicauda]|uniref:uncharacterized protein n=1 Tax=Palaemon carinicauda TaxID=392227 RepID=UPI0035B5ACDC